jgi:hypothetical protein
MRIEKISAMTLKVASMRDPVRLYGDVLGMKIVFGGEDAFFSSLRAKHGSAPILNLARSSGSWLGTDDFLRGGCGCILGVPSGEKDFSQRVREMRHGANGISTPDPDGPELSFARPI